MTSTHAYTGIKKISSYLNPVINNCYLEEELYDVKVINSYGKLLMNFDKINEIQMTNLNSGTYFIEGKIDGSIKRSKIMKY